MSRLSRNVMDPPGRKRQDRRYSHPKPITERALSDVYAADEDNHVRHVRAVLEDRHSGFPVFDFRKVRAT